MLSKHVLDQANAFLCRDKFSDLTGCNSRMPVVRFVNLRGFPSMHLQNLQGFGKPRRLTYSYKEASFEEESWHYVLHTSMTTEAIFSRGSTLSTPPRLIASFGMPNTTDVSSS